MPRVVSFIVLVAIVLLTSALFFQVMAQFLVPLFLAVLLVVMFRPVHEWVLEKCENRKRLAAGLTTLAIVLVVMLPLTWVLFRAVSEGIVLAQMYKQNPPDWQQIVQSVTAALRLRLEPLRISLPGDAELLLMAENGAKDFLAPMAVGGVQAAAQFVFRLIVTVAITIIALYYFLADGPHMIETVMRLSPLDDRYERQLLDEFTNISRAVVVAALLSALAQGLLAGIGYYFAGLPATFVLMVLTMFLALVPFVGSAAIWVPSCLWLYWHGHPVAAIVLTVYCGLVVSTIDNIIKPMVLHGQSGIHPLMALLSILGGVAALGPIGILVGPMIVAFLQALLNMLRTEMITMGKKGEVS